ncbi:MAG: TIGR02186 family protein [Rhodospirillales bacterium]|nr:TIGR02186 family protein [Rhodospirillales bacterium]
MSLFLVFWLITCSSSAQAAELVVDLARHLVAITTGFIGSDVLLFGATDGDGDVVVVVRGPENTELVRRKGRRLGIWMNEEEMAFDGVPAYYAVASSRPLDEILEERVISRHQIGSNNLRLRSPRGGGEVDVKEFREALIRNKQNAGLYSERPQPILFLGNRLFRTDLWFPANAPVGRYIVQVFLIRNGDVASAEITPLVVSKVGFEAGVYNFAQRYSLAYGVLAILIAAIAGWSASAVFRNS